MSLFANKRKRKLCIAAISVLLVLTITVAACALYLGDYYRADRQAITAFLPQGVTWQEEPDGTIVMAPAGATTGLIFYPGGKVEYTAYLPLMQALAERGILCVLLKMPFHLAVLDRNAAEGIQEKHPAITEWYIGGHSLGGSMAAAYLADHTADYAGLLLLGSYSTAELSHTDLAVLSVYGSEDRVMNREKYQENRVHLPGNFTEIVIPGGCHAGFGMYGAQEGDGTPTITAAQQITQTADAFAQLVAAGTAT
ncbi:MAG: alpha/beta hydrolase [Clostridia bacterium]|nr:alpha/beta hydrolase [Clostridia bacterium]